MTMTNDEAAKVLADHNEWRRGNDDFPATNPTKLGLALDYAIAALSAQGAAPPAQADTKQAEPCPWVRQSSEGTAYCELAESGAKQAEPLRVTREALVLAAAAMEYERVCGHSPLDALMAALHQLGAKVEVSDG